MKLICMMAIAGVASFAGAQTFSEVESNNTLGTANDIGTFDIPGGSVLISGILGDADVDWYAFTLDNVASLSVFAVFSDDADADGVMQLVTAGGDVIDFDDDSGIGFMPAIQATDLAAGTYYIGLSGFGDADSTSVDTDVLLNGDGHTENFGYKISVGFSIVPSPSTAALLGLGGLVGLRRRR